MKFFKTVWTRDQRVLKRLGLLPNVATAVVSPSGEITYFWGVKNPPEEFMGEGAVVLLARRQYFKEDMDKSISSYYSIVSGGELKSLPRDGRSSLTHSVMRELEHWIGWNYSSSQSKGLSWRKSSRSWK